jgi:hypothetical protein
MVSSLVLQRNELTSKESLFQLACYIIPSSTLYYGLRLDRMKFGH